MSALQKDGRFYVLEIHIDDSGMKYEFEYLADETYNIKQILLDRAAQLDIDLAKPASVIFTIAYIRLQLKGNDVLLAEFEEFVSAKELTNDEANKWLS